MSMTITKANLRNDETLVQEVQRLMQPVQDAWTRIAEQGAART
jgi:flagellin-specific chaperone FliS